MAGSIDRLPIGIYKSMMAKAYRLLNHPVIYDDIIYALPSVFKPTEMFSPCRNTDYDLNESKKRFATRKYNKERNLKSRQTFMQDYLKSLNY
jgi:hypothetical protein